MKNVAILLSMGVLSVALPAHSAVLKEKPTVTRTTVISNINPVENTVMNTQTPTTFVQNNIQSTVQNVVQTANAVNSDLTLTTVSYPKFEQMQWLGTDVQQLGANIPKPTLTLSSVSSVPTVIIPATKTGDLQLNVSVIDDFIAYVSPMARHYPPVFTNVNRTDRYNTIQRMKQLVEWIDPYAQDKNASYDVLLRATKLNAMARNLDLGSDYAVRASDYVSRAIRINDSAEANFLYGAMLAEGGGFDEGSRYLEKAERMGFAEATQSLAQADLLNDKKERAIERLYNFKAQYPNDPYIDEQIRLVNSGEYYIWNIPVKVLR